MDQPRFRAGELSTAYIAEEFPEGFHGLAASGWQRDAMTAAACAMHRVQVRRNGHAVAGLRPARPRDEWVVVLNGQKRRVLLSQGEDSLAIDLQDEDRTLALDAVDWKPGRPVFRAALDGRAFAVEVAPAAEGFRLRQRAASAHVLVLTPVSADLHERLPPKKIADTSRLVLSPMPGLVVSIEVEPGQEVKAGETLCIVEAMKMQNIIRAERDGVIKSVGVKAGDSVSADEVLAEFA
jgi:propionyl-CoA carboxylase alpha chain